MTNRDVERAEYRRAFEAARLGVFLPASPELEARSGGSTLAGIRDVARNTLRSTWAVLSAVLSLSANDELY